MVVTNCVYCGSILPGVDVEEEADDLEELILQWRDPSLRTLTLLERIADADSPIFASPRARGLLVGWNRGSPRGTRTRAEAAP